MKTATTIINLIRLFITAIGFPQAVVHPVRELVFETETKTPLTGAKTMITGTKKTI